ncbi:MAG: hypothetical protein Q7V57_19610 [Actinomycetota bacterium]|nr:hypothetical protein [Actinomycetota bacterium]
MTAPTPEQQIADWVQRDAAVGRTAQVEELHARLATAEAEVAQLRVRLAQLTNSLAQVEVERNHYRRASGAGGTLQIKLITVAKKALRFGTRVVRKVMRKVRSR